MTSFELSKGINAFLRELADDTNLVQMLSTISSLADDVFSTAHATVSETHSTSIENANKAARNQAEKASSMLKNYRISVVYSEIRRLEQALDKFYTTLSKDQQVIRGAYHERVHKLTDAFDSFASSHSYADVIAVLAAGQNLYSALMSDKGMLELVSRNLIEPQADDPNGYERVNFFFEGELSVEQMGKKLTALDEIYKELCRVVDVDPKDYPLRPVKIESGTFDISVAGWGGVILLLTPQVIEGAKLLYNIYGSQPQNMAWLRGQKEAFTQLTAVRDVLSERGLDTSEIDDRLKRVSTAFSDNVLTFTSSHAVRVNGTVVAIQPTMLKSLPAGPTPPKQLPS